MVKSAGVNNPFYNDNVIVRIYSDNILFAQKSMCKAAPMFDFYILRLYMAHYQLYLLSNGLLSRVFITQGKLFINDSFVIGSALVRVHKGEEEIAKYPRVSTQDLKSLSFLYDNEFWHNARDLLKSDNMLLRFNKSL